jgi:hypothetical protein
VALFGGLEWFVGSDDFVLNEPFANISAGARKDWESQQNSTDTISQLPHFLDPSIDGSGQETLTATVDLSAYNPAPA